MGIFDRIDGGMTTGGDTGCVAAFVVAAAFVTFVLSGIIVWLLINAPTGV